jgi:predicted protein tyrosine phosphatase
MKATNYIWNIGDPLKRISIAGQANHARSSLKSVLDKHPKEFDAIIINGPEDSVPDYVPDSTNNHLHLQFDDVIFDYGHMVKPEKHHVAKALEWAKGRNDIVVACHAGISRSSAIAYAIVCQEHNIEDALSILDPERHQPNKRIVYLAAKILNNPFIWDKFVEWSTKYLDDNCSSFKKWFDNQPQ